MSVQIVRFGTEPQLMGEVEEAIRKLLTIIEKVGEWAGGPVPPSTLRFVGRYLA